MSSYQTRSLDRLELPQVLERLAALCACELGRARVRALQPSNENAVARARLALTSQAREFTQIRNPPFGGLTDVSGPLQAASIGSILDALPLLTIGRASEGARRLRVAILDIEPELDARFPRLIELAERIVPRSDVEKTIFDAIDDNAELRDDASLDLLKARRGIRQTQSQIQTRLRAMLSDSRLQGHLQDQFVTVRDGRYCLPVKAESRASVPGIVHDRSGSGNAVFIEPQAVVELNNRLRELAADEKEAAAQVLRSLSAYVGGAADDLKPAMQAAGELDFAFAKARLSAQMNGRAPLLRDEVTGWQLCGARHPLVEGCVPNDIQIGDESAVTERGDFDVMMLTGPNTGGKTIVLKTLGLLTAMAGCGLHLPVEDGSWLHLPPQIHVDIGDEQSIEQSLSTFSGHLKNIIGILETVQMGDLVLFDEIGAGTDPDEGAALAKATLRALSRKGARVVATTHYGELKQFALSALRFENASVEFDPISLSPTYRLRIGVPGASNALDIASRLGMPPDIIARSRKYMGRDRLENEAAAQRLEETQRDLTQQAEDARRARAQAEDLKRDYERRIAIVEREKEKSIEGAKREARELVERAAREADEALRELRKAGSAGGENKGTEGARARLRSLREQVVQFDGQGEKPSESLTIRVNQKDEGETDGDSDSARNGKMAPPHPSILRGRLRAKPKPAHQFKVGDLVRVKSVDREGEIVGVNDEKIEVRVGAMKIAVAANDLDAAKKVGGIGGVGSIQARKGYTIADEINIIGKRVDEAFEELEPYLDDAILAGKKTVRIVHGRGTGALRGAIHQFLKTARGVKSYQLAEAAEGGDGATVVKLG